MRLVWATLLAVAAGATFALGAYLQQEVASKRPENEALSPRLLARLAGRRRWLGGIAFDVVSYGLKALALAFGPLLLVQPVIVSNLLIAVPLSLRRQRLHMTARVWAGCVLVAGGLALAVLSARPSKGDHLPSMPGWLALLAVIAVVGTGAVLVSRRLHGPLVASSIAVAAALILATQSALMQATVARFETGVTAALLSWEPYAMAVASIGALLLVQSAYQAGPLAASMPVVDVVNPLTAITIGVLLFGERIAPGLLPLLGAGAGLGVMIAGTVLLDTSPTVHRAHRRQRSEQPEGPANG